MSAGTWMASSHYLLSSYFSIIGFCDSPSKIDNRYLKVHGDEGKV
jgi:hypothetical protein